MAGDWIAMRCDLATDPAVIAMAGALGMDEFAIVGRLHRLWSWADQHLVNGRAEGVTAAWINRYLVTEMFAENLEKVGWLRVTETGVAFPKWTRHNGKSGKKRALTNERVARHRARKRNADGVTKSLPEKRREQKRKEEVPTDSERDPHASSDGPGLRGVLSDDGRRVKLLDLQTDTPVNRWLLAYQNHRPGAGHPLRDLTAEEMADARMRVEDLVEQFEELGAVVLLAEVFAEKPRPTSVRQAVLFCQRKAEARPKTKPVRAAPLKPGEWILRGDDGSVKFRAPATADPAALGREVADLGLPADRLEQVPA